MYLVIEEQASVKSYGSKYNDLKICAGRPENSSINLIQDRGNPIFQRYILRLGEKSSEIRVQK